MQITRNIKSFFLQLGHTCTRFPLSLLCALVACVLLISANHMPYSPNSSVMKSTFIRIAIESMAGISLFYSFHIYSENKDLDWAKRFGFILLGFCLLGLHFYSVPNDVYNFGINYTLRYIVIILCFHLIISFSLYNQQSELEAFWQYNEYLFVRFFTTLFFTIVFFAGVAGAMWAVDVLFGINIHERYYIDVLLLMIFLFNTFFFFNTVPIDTHYFEKEKTYQNSLRIFVQYILIPITILYGSILTIYLGKILVTHVLPKGWVAIPILIFSGLGILTYLLSYPIRDAEKNIIHYFCKYIFIVILPFVTLFFNSLIKRISIYGFTEQRYIALVLGIWLAFVCIYILASKLDNIIFFPVSLCILFALASFGPWGMYKFSANQQYNRLEKILESNHLIENGKVVSTPHPKINKEDSKQLNSILTYLYTHNEIERLKKILSSSDKQKLDKFILDGYDEKNVGDLLGLTGNGIQAEIALNNYFTCNSNSIGVQNMPIRTFGFQRMIQFSAMDYGLNNLDFVQADSNIYTSFIQNNELVFLHKGDTSFKINLNNYALQMKSRVLQSIGDSTFFDKTISNITLPYRQQYFDRDTLLLQSNKACLYIDEVKFLQAKDKTQAIFMNGYAIF
jgi:Domain of unknown function (DUF4153)